MLSLWLSFFTTKNTKKTPSNTKFYKYHRELGVNLSALSG